MSDAQTTAKLQEALLRAYPLPEYATLFEVGDATGGRHSRWADAVSMACWPSRGLAIIGFEIKASRSDWLREKKNVAKSVPVQQYCDRWLLVTAPNVVADGELPDTWGHLELSGNKLITRREATQLDPVPLKREFVASLLRRAGQASQALINASMETTRAAALAQVQERVDREVERRTRKATEVIGAIEKFKAVTGIDLTCWTGHEADKHFKLFHDFINSRRHTDLERIADSYRKMSDQVLELHRALADFDFTVKDAT